MPKSRDAGTEESPGMLRRMAGKVFKGKKSIGEEPARAAAKRQAYSDLECLRALRVQQDEGFDGEMMGQLLKLDEHETVFGREGASSYFCDSEQAPVLSLEATPEPRDWPKDFASWSVSVHETSVSSFCTFIDLEHEVDGIPMSIIVRAQIGGLHEEGGWERLRLRVKEAETAYLSGIDKAKAFDVVVNDCGSISYVLLKTQG